MNKINDKIRLRRALTLVEVICAMVMITIIFAAVLPQFSLMFHSWDSKQGAAEALQNGRVLMDHISRNLSKAKRITAVSASTITNGYIQFVDNNNVNDRYDITSANSYVEYGAVGALSDLAGPVSSFKFTCYDVCDNPLSPVTDANAVRLIQINATFTNSASLGQPKTFTTWAYLRTNANTSGIVGCWNLDETSGLTATDGSGSGNNGTLVNGPTWNPTGGQIGGALVLDGIDDYVNLGTDSSLNFGSSAPFTVAAWVKTTDNYGMIVSFRSSTDDGSVIDLSVGYDGVADNPGKAMFLVRQDGGGGGYAHVIGWSVNDGQWHHVAVVRGSGSTIELFLDGVSQGTSSGAESGGAITTNLRAIGSERCWVNDGYGTSDQRYLAGTIDDVRIYNRALSAGEIAELANILSYRGFNEAKAVVDTATSLPISTPLVNTGDLLIAAVATDEDTSATLSAPSGWTSINSPGSYSGAVTLGAWWRIATATEPASHTFTWTGGQQAYGWMMRFTGHNSTSPINGTPSVWGGSSSTPTSPAVTTTVGNCLILRLGAFDGNDVNTLPAPGNPGLSGHTAITMDATGSRDSVGWWNLDETSGLTATDGSGSGNNGTLVNGPTWNPAGGRIGGALVLDGIDDYVNLGTDSSLNFGSSAPFTVAAWVKTTDNYGMIVSFRSSTDGGPVIDLAVGYNGVADNPGKAMILVRQDGGSSYANVIGGSVNDGQWHHVAVVRGSGSTIELFLDGVSQGTASDTQSGGAITTDLRAMGSERRWVNDGYGTSDQRYLAGTIDDVHIYNRALSAGEIATLYSGNQLGSSSGGTVSGGAGYIRQPATGNSGTSTFTLGSASAAWTLTIAIAPSDTNSYPCCQSYIVP